MKKTALTMTDSEKTCTDKVYEFSDSLPEIPDEESQALRIVVEQQEVAMDMIMRKYREHVDSLIKDSHLDVWKLFYKRYLNTILNQANKMDKMTKMMRKNLLIIFKYEEIMKQIEYENESLRALVRKLTPPSEETRLRAETGKVVIDVGSQTYPQGITLSKEDKSVGPSMTKFGNLEEMTGVQLPEKQDKCTEIMLYTPFSDSFAYFGTIHNTRPPSKPLDVEAAFDLYVNRFSEETKKLTSESTSLSNVTSMGVDGILPSEVEETGKFEDSSEEPSSTRAFLSEGDELSSEMSIMSLIDDSCSKQDSIDDVFDGSS